MSETPKAHVDDGIEVEESLVEALFSSEARRDPHPFFRSVSLPGCRYAVADRMLRDGRFGARLSSQSVEPLPGSCSIAG